MTKTMLIDAAHPEEVRVALLEQGKVEDFDFESAARKPLRGNIYLARITRVEPSLQAAFVEYGGNRHGFLAFSEIHPDYYQIPVSDREILRESEAEVAALAAKLELVQRGEEDDDGDLINDDGTQKAEADDIADEPSSDRDDSEDEELNTDQDDLQAEDADSTEIESGSGDDAQAEEVDPSSDVDEEDEEEDVKDDTPENSDAAVAPEKSETKESAKDEIASEATSENDEEINEQPDQDDDTVATDEASDTPDAETVDVSEETETVEAEAVEPAKKKTKRKKRESRADIFEQYKEAKRKRSRLLRNYKIQEVIKRRQILLIQVVKEERGNKGAALTTYMSLAGRYCVLMPNTARGGGISRKIATASDRKRLRRVVDSLDVPQGMGLIIRTAGAKRTKTEVKRDYDYLLRLWENIRTLTLKSVAPCLIYEEASLIKRAIRDLYDKDISKVLVEGETGYREAKDFMKMLMPSHAKNVQPYKERAPIFLKHNVESQLDGMYQPTVRLKSGGYIVIHQTEALIAIDVNSGRSTRERNIELTALKTNIEAAQEAARQFRLRDLAGLIVLDFIDMEEPKNNRKVEKALKEGLKSDRARIQVGRISGFGLLEMSRQRRRSGIIDGTTHSCPTCSGAGVVRSHEMAALRILRAIEGEAISGKVGHITAHTSLDVSLYILNHNRSWLDRIERSNGVQIEILADQGKAGDAFELEKSGQPVEPTADAAFVRADQMEPVDVPSPDEAAKADTADANEDDEQADGGKKRKRRRRRRREPRDGADAAVETNAQEATSEKGSSDSNANDTSDDDKATRNADADDSEDAPKRRRRRGRRGGRRNRRGPKDDEASTASTDDAASSEQSDTKPSEGNQENAEAAPIPAAPTAITEPAIAEAPIEKVEPKAAKPSKPSKPVEPKEAEPVAEEAAPKAKKTTRKGWWKKAIG